MKQLFTCFLFLLLAGESRGIYAQENSSEKTALSGNPLETLPPEKQAEEQGPLIQIRTRLGNMTLRLYNDTPIHRDFILSQIRKGYFDGSLFGRVLYGFVIQGGSEDSKGAPAGQLVGHGRSSMLLAPEMREHHFPKKGALAMPRQPDDINPQKKSDASQIFIVQGRVYSSDELRAMEIVRNKEAKTKAMKQFYTPLKKELDSLKRVDPLTYNIHVRRINRQIDSVIRRDPNHLLFLPQEKEAYTTIGGSPHLRGEYTILGEVVEGMEVIDKIAELEVDRHNRPLQDVTMTVTVLKP